ncbi:MAG: sensor histidine kinase [Nitrospirae bacterium]|nr:sensor histidine kinase [Nitrospirota bacterium]
MEDLSLHILDVIENSINADAAKIRLTITEDTGKNLFSIEITDNGRGMDEEAIKMASDPFFTTKAKRTGLGIPFLADAAREAGGNISIKSGKGQGTTITANFQHDHIDRKPLGDIEKTIAVLIAAGPHIDFIFEFKRNEKNYLIDTAEIKEKLGDVPVNDPEVINFIKDGIRQWLKDTQDMIRYDLNKSRHSGL